jgi:crotonobetainyl-CoA:carnitine CoA-transferase CaiB-like acyl-CoA transferase
MSITGLPDGAPGAGPVRVGIALTDTMTALYATIAVQAALLRRERSGQGEYIDLSLLDVQVSALSAVAMNFLVSGKVPTRRGNRLPTVYPSDTFRCQDGYLMLIVGNDQQFTRLCSTAGLGPLNEDPRFCTNAMRVTNADALSDKIGERLQTKPVREWLDLLEKAQVSCAPINDIAQVFADPQVVARGMRVELPHPLSGTVPGVSNPIRFGDRVMQSDRAPPTLGQHTREVLEDVLGLNPAEIDAIQASGAVG